MQVNGLRPAGSLCEDRHDVAAKCPPVCPPWGPQDCPLGPRSAQSADGRADGPAKAPANALSKSRARLGTRGPRVTQAGAVRVTPGSLTMADLLTAAGLGT